LIMVVQVYAVLGHGLLSGWYSLMIRWCSLILFSMGRPVCPVQHGIPGGCCRRQLFSMQGHLSRLFVTTEISECAVVIHQTVREFQMCWPICVIWCHKIMNNSNIIGDCITSYNSFIIQIIMFFSNMMSTLPVMVIKNRIFSSFWKSS
jgi:hypothetical protein